MKYQSMEEEIRNSHKKFMAISKMEKMLIHCGYLYMEPILLEDYDSFAAENNRIDNASTVKVMSGNGSLSILSPDITTTLVGTILDKGQSDIKAKIFYNGKVFRSTEMGIQEIRKLGAEYIGENDLSAELEIIDLCLEILDSFGGAYVFEIGCSNFIRRLLREVSLNRDEYRRMMELIATKDRCGLVDFTASFPNEHLKLIFSNFFDLAGSYEEIEQMLRALYVDEDILKSLCNLKEIDAHIREFHCGANVVYDLATISELDYYTGIVFRGYLKGANTAVIRGGRYKLESRRLKNRASAVGFSVEVDDLMTALKVD